MATRDVMMVTRLQPISTIPLTVLSLLPPHLDSITALVSLLTLFHFTRSIILETLTPPTLFHLCYISPTIFPPWYLLSIISPSLSTRLSTTAIFRNSFKLACRHGPTSLLSHIHTQPSSDWSERSKSGTYSKWFPADHLASCPELPCLNHCQASKSIHILFFVHLLRTFISNLQIAPPNPCLDRGNSPHGHRRALRSPGVQALSVPLHSRRHHRLRE